ncbi:MAG: YwiC-like family protein [Candidatus Nanopelagicales bacterium]
MPAVTAITRERVRPARRVRNHIPPQHGAWAFLVVPLLVAVTVGPAAPGRSLWGWLFAAAWIAAYPVSYFAGRALGIRARRGMWTRLARRELGRAVPWAAVVLACGLPLALTSPWLLGAAALLGLAWLGSLVLAGRLGERSLGNDLALVAQAVVAVPLLVALLHGPSWDDAVLVGREPALWTATAAVGVYLFGTVMHVKTLLRRAGDQAFRRVSIGYHLLAVLIFGALNVWWLLAFVPALARAALLRPGLRPPVIGAIEAVGSALFVAAAFLACSAAL